MGISIGSSYLDAYSTQATNSLSANKAGNVSSSIGGISKDSTKEELTEAVKSFEQYFVEQMLKNLKESFKSIGGGEESSPASMTTDYYMDFAISDVARKLVDEVGGQITDDFVAQIARNYGIEDNPSGSEAESTQTEMPN